MPKIRTLPDYLINQIAAGEVVERPFAVVKELVENSIDANSHDITIHIRDGGKKLIQISDDGHGMPKDDIILAIQRHATSKLPDDKLHLVNSYGFRGEALPSIASVSRMNIISNIEHQDHGWSLFIEGGDIGEIIPDNHTKGTKITVRDLFFAVPARLKFLRTARSEIVAINDVITRLALANPHISFQLYDDDRLKYHYHAIDNNAHDSKKQRITQVLGKEFSNNIIAVDYQASDYSIRGYIGLPTHNRANATQQYYFVNQRPVKDKLLIAALRAAYGDVIPNGRHGVCVLWIDCDGLLVDVNAHPAKTEIRFRDYQQMRQLLIHAVNRALSDISGNLKAGQTSTGQLANNFMQYAQNYVNSTSKQHYDLRESKKPYDYHSSQPSQQNMATAQQMQAPISDSLLTDNMPPNAGNLASTQSVQENHHYPLGAALAQIHFNYILAQNDKGLVIIDQHAAHERIVYEHIKTQLSQHGQVKRQMLLLPESVYVNKDDGHLLMQQQEKLAKLGLMMEYRNDNIIITETPALLGNIAITPLIMDMIDCLRDYGNDDILHDRLFYICATMACHGSIRSGRKLNIDEMNALLREMEACPYSAQCNHGRPAYIEISKSQIETLFER